MGGVGEGNFTVLNVLGKNMMKARYLRDRLDVNFGEADAGVYYNERDLRIGNYLNVYNRNVMLTDCDGKTREYYRIKYGFEEFDALPIPGRGKFENGERKEFSFPPYNGWGSYEDSEGNCLALEPHKPKINFKNFLKFDKLVKISEFNS